MEYRIDTNSYQDYQAELERGFRSLRFSAALEEQFLQAQAAMTRGRPVLALASALHFWPALATSLAVLVLTLALYAIRGLEPERILHHGLAMLLAVIAGAAILYWLEYSQRKAFLQSRLRDKLAGQDPLTGLVNTQYFAQHLKTVWKHCGRNGEALTLARLQIDGFKAFVDMHGPDAGNDCLRRVAAEIQTICRRPLDLACREHAAIFIVALPGARADHAQLWLSRVLSKVEALHIDRDEAGTRITLSAGIAQACSHDGDTTPDILLRLADDALQTARHKGGNRVMLARPEAEEESLLSGVFHRSNEGLVTRNA